MRWIKATAVDYDHDEDAAEKILDVDRMSRWGYTDTDDPALHAACTASLELIQATTGRSLYPRTATAIYHGVAIPDELALLVPGPPIQSIDSVSVDTGDGWETLDEDDYRAEKAANDYGRVYARRPWPTPRSWDYGTRVVAEVGAEDMPDAIQTAVLMAGLYMYEKRGSDHGNVLKESGALPIIRPYMVRGIL